MWENAYSSSKSVETAINLCIILFDYHSHAYKLVFVILSIFSEMHLCEGWVWENAYSGSKSVETAINLCIILFDNHSHAYKSVFCYS